MPRLLHHRAFNPSPDTMEELPPRIQSFWREFLSSTTDVQDWDTGAEGTREGSVWMDLDQDLHLDDAVWIEHIESRDKRKGKGGAALKWLTNLADKWGVTLLLAADPQGPDGLSLRPLKAWYRRHGFKPVRKVGRGRMMRRLPFPRHGYASS